MMIFMDFHGFSIQIELVLRRRTQPEGLRTPPAFTGRPQAMNLSQLWYAAQWQGFGIGVDQEQEGAHCEGGATSHKIGQMALIASCSKPQRLETEPRW